jgi:hypothetical protein
MQHGWSAHDRQTRPRVRPGTQQVTLRQAGAGYRPRTTAAKGRGPLRLLILAALGLTLLIWRAPRVGSFLVSDVPRLADQAMHSVVTWATQTFTRVPDGVSSLAAPHAQHQFWQVGLTTGDEDAHATGMAASIVTTLPQQVSADTTSYYWVGSYLADGSFIQAGYYVPARDAQHAGWFYCAFLANGKEGPCAYGALGSAGGNGAIHTYTLESVTEAPGSATVWRAELDGAPLGQFAWTTGESGSNTPVIYAESSGYTPHAATSVLGPVDFPQTIQVRRAGTTVFARAAHLWVVYDAPNVCPPYGISWDGRGGVLLGSGLACPDRWSEFG